MASTIAAVTTSGGGVVTTADASGNLNLLAGTTTVVALTAAGAAVSGTLSASSGYNGTVGATTPATGAFTTLSASGVFSAEAGGTAAAPSITFVGDTDTGIARVAANTFIGSSNGTEIFRVAPASFSMSGASTITAANAVMTIGDNSRTVSSSTTTGAIVCGGGLGVWSTVNAGGSGNFADTVSVFTQNPSNTAQGVLFRNLYNIGPHLFSQGAATTNTYISWLNGNGTVGSIAATGSGVAYNTSSDYRLKNTIAPMTGALAKVALLKPVTYKWNVDGSDGQGFIAHELAEVEPNCVTGEKDATREEEYEITPAVPAVLDADGKETTPAVEAVKGTRTVPSYQGVDTSFLVATLTAAIQELKAIIDTQATRITALEAK